MANTTITTLVKINPDTLSELAQRLKSQAMDFAYPGEVVMVPLNDRITLLYEPASEFCKPLTRVGYSATYNAQEVDNYAELVRQMPM